MSFEMNKTQSQRFQSTGVADDTQSQDGSDLRIKSRQQNILTQTLRQIKRYRCLFFIIGAVILIGVLVVTLGTSEQETSEINEQEIIDEKKDQFSQVNRLLIDMFESKNLQYYGQVQNCLSGINKSVDQTVISILKLLKFPENQLIDFGAISDELPKNIISCVSNSNDIYALLRSFNIGTGKWQQFVEALNNLEPPLSSKQLQQEQSKIKSLIEKAQSYLMSEEQQTNLGSELVGQIDKLVTQRLPKIENDQWGLTATHLYPQIPDANLSEEQLRQKYPNSYQSYYGISLSNGFFGVTTAKRPFLMGTCVLAGTYDKGGPSNVDTIVESINPMHFQLIINSTKIDSETNTVGNYQQSINYKKAEVNVSMAAGAASSINYQMRALKHIPSVFYADIDVHAHEDIEVLAKNWHLVPDSLRAVNQFGKVDYKTRLEWVEEHYHLMVTKAKTKNRAVTMAISSGLFVDQNSTQFLDDQSDLNAYTYFDDKKGSSSIGSGLLRIPRGSSVKLHLYSSILSSVFHHDPENQASRLLIRAMTESNVTQKHYQQWEKIWEYDILINTQEKQPSIAGIRSDEPKKVESSNEQTNIQQTVHSLLYHLYTFVHKDFNFGLSPMGLSGTGYNGHMFWDMDLWVFPALLVMNPSMAKTLINYRFDRLEAAKRNAKLNGYRGAMYPWQSQANGQQSTPLFAECGVIEHHITGTVALAAWQYYVVTKDLEWLQEKGRHILEETAKFWESRVTQNEETGEFHINMVSGADQFAIEINDDAFTNAVAKENLRIVNKMNELLGVSINSLYEKIQKGIVIHRFVPDDLEPGTEPFEIVQEHSSYDGEDIKQADVSLLAYPLSVITEKEQIMSTIAYYSGKVPRKGTPAMSKSIYAILYSRIGQTEKAEAYFKKSYQPNSLPPFKVLSEEEGSGNPYFLTGCGGTLQTLIFGFGGLQITDNGIEFKEVSLPESWEKLTIRGVTNMTRQN